MQLNESAQKLDSQLDQVCRKLEKVAFDTAPDANLTELTYYPNFNQRTNGSKCTTTPLTLSFSDLQRVYQDLPVEHSQIQHQALTDGAHRPDHQKHAPK